MFQNTMGRLKLSHQLQQVDNERMNFIVYIKQEQMH